MSEGKRVIDFTQPPPQTVKKPKVRQLLNYLFVCQVDDEPTGKYLWNIALPKWTCTDEKGQQIAEHMKTCVLQQGTVDWYKNDRTGKNPYIQSSLFAPMGYDALQAGFIDAAGPLLTLQPTRNLDLLGKPTLHLRRTEAESYEISGDTKHLRNYFIMFGGDYQVDGTVLFAGEENNDLSYIKSNTIKLADTFGYVVTFDLPE